MSEQTLEILHGQGSLYEGEYFLSNVYYQLCITQNSRTIRSRPGKSYSGIWRFPGQLIVKGELEIISGERTLLGALTLRLADQRQWHCLIQSGNATSGKYQAISGAGGLTVKP